MNKKNFSVLLIVVFLFSLTGITACSSTKKPSGGVKSGSGMGNSKHKNKHVWGK